MYGGAQLGSTAIGLVTRDGVILAVEKHVTSPLMVRNLYLEVQNPIAQLTTDD